MKFALATARKFWQIISKKKLTFLLMLAIATYCSITILQPAIATYSKNEIKLNISSQLSQSAQPSLLEQGSRLYEQGNLTEAVATWQKALLTYRNRQSSETDKLSAQLNEALCLNYLSMAYQELGEWQQAQTTIAQSSALLDQQLLNSKEGKSIAARISNTQGSLQLAMGNPQTALESWKTAEERYTQLGDDIGILGSQTNQAQALQALGLFRLASEQLEAIELRLQKQPDSMLKSVSLHSLGTTLQTLGDLTKSQKILEQSLSIAQKLNNPAESSATLISIGNNFRFIKDVDVALQKYEQAAAISPVNILRLEAQALNLSLLIESDRLPQVQALWQQIEPELTKLQPSRRSIYLIVNLSESLMKIKALNARPISTSEMANLLTMALKQAQTIQDRRAESFAIGALGGLYEQNQQLDEAYQLAQRALALAQSANADDLLYRWQWLSGRILNQQGKTDLAIPFYNQAIKNIQNLRRELIATSPEVQFAFRDRIEPIYRELVSLLLKSDQPSQENLIQARLTLESLQVVELENFFRAACLNIQPQQIDAIDSNSAVIYSAILRDRLAIILSLPKEPLQYYSANISQTELEENADKFLQALHPAFSERIRLKVSQKLYDLILRPIEKSLTEKQIKNLVFVLDGSLRNLPMAALHDGKQYVVEKYSVALTPGLQILGAKALDRSQLRVWLGALSESRQGFAALDGVKFEASQIAKTIPTDLELNNDFTKLNLRKGLTEKATPIVHLATHGQFSSDPESTFILAWDDRITVPDFYKFLRDRTDNRSQPLELLVLSACKTAEGDVKAILGLAGIALRSGARSTIGSLWAVNDESTSKLMSNFYDILIKEPTISKAEALQKSQISILKDSQYKHPYYWAAFVLVGSWL
ncbi:CHAT domain-containing protein [Pseudanabaena sp. UWO311]|uniref:CHAT domain-containing protein n=1 Tax=Pseudanabaena sp. UWO311 TaxID=2487337 RepID=UPI001158EB6F|nr:CHAT domain-containing protein [Pseudanabaena sp. UWO311]TYQ27976.1 CHAT domain-containing protein [Pseudanabaena sp. UWO311]